METNILGHRIRLARTMRGMTQVQLADAIGLAAGNGVSAIERGLQSVSVAQLETIARTLDVTAAQLLGETDLVVGAAKGVA